MCVNPQPSVKHGAASSCWLASNVYRGIGEGMTLHIDVNTTADQTQLDQIKRELAMYCPIAKLIRASGTQLNEVWTVAP